MKYLLSILIVSFAFVHVMAQSARSRNDMPANLGDKVFLDSSYMECVYSYKVFDPAYDETREDFKILEIGRHLSKYSDYGYYQLDSLIYTDYPKGMTKGQFHKYAKVYLPSHEATIKEFSSGTLLTYDKVYIDNYMYQEPLSLMKWNLVPGSEMICGYKCRKATTSFRGRKWTAWYAPEIPIDNGPWKFGGLPGLILKIESDDNDHHFVAVAIRRNRGDIQFLKRNLEKTTRKKYNEELKEYCRNPHKYLTGNTMAPKDKEGNLAVSEFRRLFFNPIELE